MKEATGEYIIYLDGDDTLYEKTTLEKIDRELKRNTPDICYFGVQYVESETGKTKIYLPNAENSCKKALHLTMIAVNGVAHNDYAGIVQNEITGEDLFA